LSYQVGVAERQALKSTVQSFDSRTVRKTSNVRVLSYEKLLHKYPQWVVGTKEDPFHMMPFNRRLEVYFGDTSLGRPLKSLLHVFEWMQRRPECFFVFKFEDFNENPAYALRSMYNWLGMPNYEHDLNNVELAKQYEHDTAYRALVSHKTERQVRKLEPSWPKMMTEEQSNLVIQNNEWFYQTFYPEIYYDYVDRQSNIKK
jgi:hypothetical protein